MQSTKEPLTYSFSYQDAVEVLRLVRENESVTSFELELGDIKLSVSRANGVPGQSAVPHGAVGMPSPAARPTNSVEGQSVAPRPDEAPASANAGLACVVAPMLGIFYRAPSPGAPPFVNEGDHVNAGDTVGLIEVMKLFTQVTAEHSGRIVRIEALDGELVEHGQTLLLIEPSQHG